jgi:hypothetical protein
MTQDKCMVYAECTIGSEIIFETIDGTPAWVIWNLVSVHLEMVLVLVQNRCIVCAKCTIGSKIIFDSPKGTPR